MLSRPLLGAWTLLRSILASGGAEAHVSANPGLIWEDPDCLETPHDFGMFLDIFGEDAEHHSEDSPDWMILSGYASMVGKPDRADYWPSIRERLPLLEEKLPAALSSNCLGVRAYARAVQQLLHRQYNDTALEAPLPLIAASKFPTFRLLCAASEPSDGLAEVFFAPASLRSDQWMENLWKMSEKVVESRGWGGNPLPAGLVGSRWTLHLMMCLMGLRSGAQSSIEGIEDILARHPLGELLNSSLFCLLHGLKLYRLRPLKPRRKVPELTFEDFWKRSEELETADKSKSWRGHQTLFVSAAWGAAAPSAKRWVRNMIDLKLPGVLYCLDNAAFRHCQEALDIQRERGGDSVVKCHVGTSHGDVHGADKYELVLAVLEAAPSDNFTVVWTDLDGVFLRAPPPDAFEDVRELGLVRHARSACLNGGFLVAKRAATTILEHIIHWIHHFPFGYEQNALNAIARDIEGAPLLKAPQPSVHLLPSNLFVTGVDAIGAHKDAVWLHLWTPPSYSLDDLLEEVADRGHLTTFISQLDRQPRPENLQLECVLAQVALRAPILLHFSLQTYDASWLKKETVEESEFQRSLFTVVGRAYSEGRIVQQNSKKALQMYRRAASLGSQEAYDAVQALDPRRQISQLF